MLSFFLFKDALASTWQFQNPHIINEELLDRLKKDFPRISEPADASQLLEAIASQQAFNKLEIFRQGTGFVIQAEAAKKIRKLEIKTLTRQLRYELSSKSYSYIGLVDSRETRKRLRRDFTETLKGQGFYLPNIKIEERQSDETNIDLQVTVEENFPCLIREVLFGFKLPDDIKFPLNKGNICETEIIEGAISQLEENLRNRGYNQQKILPAEVRFDTESNSAQVYIPGTIGRKVSYEIDSPIRNPAIISFLFGDELNTLDPSIVAPDSMRTEIIRKYRSRGFDDVTVEGPTVSQPDSKTTLYRFKVNPGPEYKITEVQIEGLTVLTQEEAIEAMGLYPSLGNTPLLTQDIIRESMDNLISQYHKLGYWDIRLNFPRITKDQFTGQTKLVFVINEGKRRILDGLVLQGVTVLDQDTIREWFPVQDRQPIIWNDLMDFEKKVRDEYKQRGYLYTKIHIDLLQNSRFRDVATRIVARIDEGPQVKIGKIEVIGLVKTNPEVVLRELRFEEGDVYNPELIEESRLALIELGLFGSVSIRPQDTIDLTNENESIDYLIILSDAKPGTVMFGPGWSLNEGGRFSIDTAYANLNGEGRQIFLRAAINEERDQTPIGTKTLLGRNIGLGLLEPYLLNLPVNGTLTLNHRAEADNTQWEISRSLEGILSHRYRLPGPKQRSELFGLYKTTRIEADSFVSELILVSKGDVQIREFGLRHHIEARNDISWPTQGYVFQAEAAWADYYFGGDTKYFRWSLRHSAYKELYEDFVLAVGLTYDTYQNVQRLGDNADVLPSSELVKSGGANTNRGFKENELGPVIRYRDPNERLETIFPGGSQRFSLKTEIRYQAIQDTMAISFFFDSGNSFFSPKEEAIIRKENSTKAEFYDNQPYKLEDIFRNPRVIWEKNYLSYGLSLSYLTPLGSINLSYGFPLKRCLTGESCVEPRGNDDFNKITGGQLHINVGANF